MVALFFLLAFVLGAIVASFAGVVAARLNTGESIVSGRSRCDACGAPLSPFALVPIISYLASRGRAGCCGARLSPAAPLSELTLGAFYALAYAKLGLSLALLPTLVALALLAALVLYDLAHQILPPVLLAPFVLAAALSGYLTLPQDVGATVLYALGVGGVLLAIHLASRGRAMGLADAPLAAGLALMVGGPAAIAGFVFSFWIGAVIGMLLLWKRPAGSRMGVEVPFAPFLAAGFLLAYFISWNPFALALAAF